MSVDDEDAGDNGNEQLLLMWVTSVGRRFISLEGL